MQPKKVALFLAKLFPAFFLILYFWQGLSLSTYYHRLIGGFLEWIYTSDPHGMIKGISLQGEEFVVRIAAFGRKMSLEIVAADVTTNEAMILTLYLVSPVIGRWRRYLFFFSASLLLMFSVHSLTVASIIRHALARNPTTSLLVDPRSFWSLAAFHYDNFYELMGMYLFVLGLWFPYIMTVIAELRRSSPEQGPSP